MAIIYKIIALKPTNICNEWKCVPFNKPFKRDLQNLKNEICPYGRQCDINVIFYYLIARFRVEKLHYP